MSTARVPSGLSLRGRRLWRALTSAYEFDAGESVVLSEACRTADLVDRLASRLAAEELIVDGSRGQSVLNPIAAELRLQRDLLGRLLGRLALPDADSGMSAAAVLGRRGNDARWHQPKKPR